MKWVVYHFLTRLFKKDNISLTGTIIVVFLDLIISVIRRSSSTTLIHLPMLSGVDSVWDVRTSSTFSISELDVLGLTTCCTLYLGTEAEAFGIWNLRFLTKCLIHELHKFSYQLSDVSMWCLKLIVMRYFINDKLPKYFYVVSWAYSLSTKL